MDHCKVCHSAMRFAFKQKLLRKYEVSYFFCSECGFLQSEEPYWLNEAYSTAIAIQDTGLVQRNLAISRRLSVILYFFFDRNGRYLDFAGGYGMLTRIMRDIGFDFFWADKYATNLLASGFSADKDTGPYSAVTAFEVLEHVHEPLDFVAEALGYGNSRTLIFSTETFVGEPPAPNGWWYYATEAGQHISFYQKRTLARIAKHHGLNFYSKAGIHIFTDRCLARPAIAPLGVPAFISLAASLVASLMKSKTQTDHLHLKERFNDRGQVQLATDVRCIKPSVVDR